MDEKYISVSKVNGGFIVDTDEAPRKIVRKLSEVIAILKEVLKDQPVEQSEVI